MYVSRFVGVVVALAILGFVPALSIATEQTNVVWIYRGGQPSLGNDRTRTESKFKPYGFMPAERASQIAVNATRQLDPRERTKGTCIEYTFRFVNDDDWQGVYSLLGNGNAWGSKKGVNVKKLLNVKEEDEVLCRFRARGIVGGEVVTFQCGGIKDGEYPSSIGLARRVEDDPVTLGKSFRDYSIPLEGRQLTNVIDPFCVVATALDNNERRKIKILVDDIRFEARTKGTGLPLPEQRQTGLQLPEQWQKRLGQTLFVSYTPTGFDPTVKPVKRPTAGDVRKDLAAVRALVNKVGIEGKNAGIITYGCRDGLEQIPALARKANLTVILGIYNPKDETEIRNAEALLGQAELKDTIVACCVGNEAITFRRASYGDIESVIARLKKTRRVPMTTTEIYQSYGNDRLFRFDYTLANCHPIFARKFTPTSKRGRKGAAEWSVECAAELLAIAPKDHPVLIKEFGFPRGPLPLTPQLQADYWNAVLQHPVSRRVNVCIFDAFRNTEWKNEQVTLPGGKKVNVGPYWAVLFDAQRRPTRIAEEILLLWKKSRPH